MEWLFVGSVAFVVYTYFVYPAAVVTLARLWRRARRGALKDLPPVAVIVPAHNEAAHIAAKLRNLLASNYPADRLRVVVVSDGSTDSTVQQARSIGDARVVVVENTRRGGKVSAVNLGVSLTDEPVLVMTDASELFHPDAIRRLVENFADAEVGVVSGELRFIDMHTGFSRNLGAYWLYEKAIRNAEGRIGSVVGVTGAIYAIRRACFVPVPGDTLLDDVAIPLEAVRRGYRVKHESQAIAFEHATLDSRQEFLRKRRTLAGNYQLIARYADLLVPGRSPIAVQFWSHKVFRLLVPYAMLGALIGSAFLPYPLNLAALAAQVGFYGLAAMAFILRSRVHAALLTLPYTFCMLNWAALAGSYYYLAGMQSAKWEKAK